MWLICAFAVVSLVVGEQTFHIGLKVANVNEKTALRFLIKDLKVVNQLKLKNYLLSCDLLDVKLGVAGSNPGGNNFFELNLVH